MSRYSEYWTPQVVTTWCTVRGGGEGITSVPRDGGKVVKNIFVTILGKLLVDYETGE